MSEQQQRMARCDQYVDSAREQCLRGDNVTIEDFKKDYKEFEKDVNAKMKAETDKAEAEQKSREDKLKEALKNAKEKADIARQEQIEKELKALEDGTK